MINKSFIRASIISFVVCVAIISVGRMVVYDSRCHEKVQYVQYGNTKAVIEPCSAPYIHTQYIGIPAFTSIPHEGEFGLVTGEFRVGLFIINIVWIVAVSIGVGWLASKRRQPKPLTEPS